MRMIMTVVLEKTMSKSLLKQAEKNVVNIAVSFETILRVLDGLTIFGNQACKEHVGKKKFFEGLQIMHEAVYSEYVNACRDCLIFAGVGGEEAKAFAKKKFREQFKGDYDVLHFLNQWGQLPGFVSTEQENQLLREAKEALGNEL